jgi:UDP-galactopyranose mutase
MRDLICICHLRWDFVWQRPQQLLSRLAQLPEVGASNGAERAWRILLVEEPVTDSECNEPWLEQFTGRGPAPIQGVRLHFPSPEHYWIGFNGTRTQPIYERLLLDYLQREGYHDPVLWLYTPMALPFADVIQPALLVFDVMDELAAFKGAAAELREFDRRLVHEADVIFTGGLSLYRTRRSYADHVYLFPSGVDIAHFAQADQAQATVPPLPADLANICRPILGYFGVIDERMDLELLAQLAEAGRRSGREWEVVLLGATTKIDQATLPQAPNLHYLGRKDYQELPAYLAYFDVALVPFAITEATRNLSPTKTLEYLAAHKPVVATPIHDLVELYGKYVRVGETPAAFVAAVEAALDESREERQQQRGAETELLARYTWDHIAAEMHTILMEALRDTTADLGRNGCTVEASEPLDIDIHASGSNRERIGYETA